MHGLHLVRRRTVRKRKYCSLSAGDGQASGKMLCCPPADCLLAEQKQFRRGGRGRRTAASLPSQMKEDTRDSRASRLVYEADRGAGSGRQITIGSRHSDETLESDWRCRRESSGNHSPPRRQGFSAPNCSGCCPPRSCAGRSAQAGGRGPATLVFTRASIFSTWRLYRRLVGPDRFGRRHAIYSAGAVRTWAVTPGRPGRLRTTGQ